MTRIYVWQQFQSVGHGTFFTGNVGDSHGARFSWAYDCGSKRSTRVSQAVASLEYSQGWPVDHELDMVAVSHFDTDHINGLELLLARHRVKNLVLPFLGMKARLAHISSAMEGEASSAPMAAFAMDPIRYLKDRGLSDRVNSILLIRGGPSDGTADGGDELPLLRQPGDLENFRPDELPTDAEEYPEGFFDGPSTGGPSVKVLSHQRPVKAPNGLPFEFVFYNSALPSGGAKRSGLPISAVRRDVDLIFRTYRLQDPHHKPRSGWRDSLQRCYDKHFGKRGNERNSISLCVLARPIVDARTYPHCAFEVYNGPSPILPSPAGGPWWGDLYWCHWLDCLGFVHATGQSDRQALLLTGDLALNADEIKSMQTHFGLHRWNEIGLTQVPHHGSQHSWKKGNAALFGASRFVQCVPTVSKHNDHPHPTVVTDLGSPLAHVADYENSVVHRFWFRV